MIARILSSPYSHVAAGQEGTVLDITNTLVTVRLETKHTLLFEGGSSTQISDVIFTKEEVEIILEPHENQTEITEPEPIHSTNRAAVVRNKAIESSHPIDRSTQMG